MRTHFIYSLLSPALLLYGVYVLSSGEKQNKIASLFLYFSVKFEDPEGIFEEVVYQLGDLNIPLLKVFGPKKKNVPHLEYYLSSFPDTLY